MNFPVIIRILGILLMVFSFAIIPPIGVGLYYGDGDILPLIFSFLVVFLSGLCAWLMFYDARGSLRIRDGFLLTTLFWVVLGVFGAIPLYLSSYLNIGFTDAVFESLSGLTTTGATVIVGLDNTPHSLLLYRQLLQWLGGMGIIVLALAVLPMLGIGGMQLYKAEVPGPVKDSKLTPRIAETAKYLWYIYVTLTLACIGGFVAAGMPLFDAVCHAFSTVAIGGFSTHDASMGYFDSQLIESVCILFMFISAANFALHFHVWHSLVSDKKPTLMPYWRDTEFRFYVMILLSVAFISTVTLLATETFSALESVRHSLFMTVSIATTTGFGTTDFTIWPFFVPFLMFFASFAGGCAGSTGGGMKVIRILLLIKQGFRETSLLLHPNAVIRIKIGGQAVPEKVLRGVWGFFSAYVFVMLVISALLLGTGLDFITAISAAAACLNNLGPGFGEVAANYKDIPDSAKWILSVAMLFGRLEIFTLLVLLNPRFWRS